MSFKIFWLVVDNKICIDHHIAILWPLATKDFQQYLQYLQEPLWVRPAYRPHQKNAIAHVSEQNAYYFMDLTFFVELCDVITYNMTNS